MAPPDAPSPLGGLKVLDLARVLAGPFAGRLLADLGADVVKVEPPDGDITRFWGDVRGGVPGYYGQQNVGKRNICVDFRAPGARDLMFDLVRKADILIENYRPDVMPRLGLGYEALSEVNPRLIMLSISGFGRDGPESHRPAYAPIVHAELGLVERMRRGANRVYDDLPLPIADTNASLHGLIATLAAVILRSTTGKGQHIDLSMMDATLVTDDQVHYELENSRNTAGLPGDVWETGAGPVLISSDFRHLWRLLTTKRGMAEPAKPDTPLEQKIALRRAAAAAYFASLATWDDVERDMAAINIAWGKVRQTSEIGAQPTIAHRRSLAEVDDRRGGMRLVPQSPYRFSAARSEVRGPAPHRGEHNNEVLAEWLGRSADDVAALIASGVLQAEA